MDLFGMQASSDRTNSTNDEAIKDCEIYVDRHNVKTLLKDCIVQLCLNKPENPVSFLKQHFEKLEKVTFNSFKTFIFSDLYQVTQYGS
jgi:hypothetical protein